MNNFIDRLFSEAPEGDRERFLALDAVAKAIKKEMEAIKERFIESGQFVNYADRVSYEVSSPDEFYDNLVNKKIPIGCLSLSTANCKVIFGETPPEGIKFSKTLNARVVVK